MIELLKGFLPILGVIVGWILSQLTEKMKASREDTRKLKKTLFYLLELRHQLSFYVSNEEHIDIYISLIKEKFSHLESVKALDEPQVKQLLVQLIQGIVKEIPLISPQEMEELNRNFMKTIDSLSEVDPILAFRLSGRQNVKNLLNEIRERSRVSVLELTKNVSDVGELDSAFQKIEPNLLKGSLGDLDEILVEIARAVGRKTAKKTKARISDKKTEKERKDIERFLEKMLKGLQI